MLQLLLDLNILITYFNKTILMYGEFQDFE